MCQVPKYCHLYFSNVTRIACAQKSAHQVNTDPMISMTGHLDVVVPPTIIDEESRSD